MSESNSKRKLMLGCIADDVTGATDLAINLVQGGMCVVQVLGVPSAEELATLDADAVVVALKTRSLPKDEAISLSLKTLEALRNQGVERIFFKYCSTFDSTEQGNIGPVAAALLDALEAQQTIFCPAFPRNGRTVYQGHLFVHGQLLHESGMELHPLNPMLDANLVRFLSKQTDRKVGLASLNDFPLVRRRLEYLASAGYPFVITDACEDQHLEQLAGAVTEMPLVTGGSGIARFLPKAYERDGYFCSEHYEPTPSAISGRSLIVAGSCSDATNKQVEWMQSKCPSWQVDPAAIMKDGAAAMNEVLGWASELDASKTAMVYSTTSPDQLASIQNEFGQQAVAASIESFLAEVSWTLVEQLGVRKLVLAGGETSGAIVNRLGVRSLRIGPEICAGVPWTESTGERPLALALKSGNFGDPDFFEKALRLLP